MKLLVLAAEVPDPQVVRDAVGEGDAEVYVVAPALEGSPRPRASASRSSCAA